MTGKNMGFFSSIGKSISKGFKSLTKGFKSNPIGSILGMTGLPQSTSQFIPGGELLQSAGSLLGSGIQDFWGSYTGETIAKKNLAAQEKQWSLQNDLNERQFAYQQQLNQQQQQREDTAMQRKVTDLRAAGLNPVLAAGGSGSPSAPLSAPAQKTAPAPYLDDYSKGGREALSQLSGAVFQALSMKKDFAMKDAEISLLRANKEKADAEAAGIRKENEYKSDWLKLRNENLQLENKLRSGTLDDDIAMVSAKLSNEKKKGLIYNMEMTLGQDKHVLNKIDIEIQKLVKEGKIKENQILDKKLELLTTECLQKALDYSNAEWDTNYYHGVNLPVGFNSGWIGQLSQMFAGVLTKNHEGANLVGGYWNAIKRILGFGDSSSYKSPFDRSYKHVAKNPFSIHDPYWRSDYGVRRNY